MASRTSRVVRASVASPDRSMAATSRRADSKTVARRAMPSSLGSGRRSSKRSLTQLLAVDPAAIDVLADLDRRRPVLAATPDELVAWKRREYLRIAARDLLGLDGLGDVGAALAEMAEDAVRGALQLAGVEGEL